MEGDERDEPPKKKSYKAFLEPNYNRSQVSRKTDRRWRKISERGRLIGSEIPTNEAAGCSVQLGSVPDDNVYMLSGPSRQMRDPDTGDTTENFDLMFDSQRTTEERAQNWPVTQKSIDTRIEPGVGIEDRQISIQNMEIGDILDSFAGECLITETPADARSSTSTSDASLHSSGCLDEGLELLRSDTDGIAGLNNQFAVHNAVENTIMFETSHLTVAEVFMMVQGLALRYHLSREVRCAIMELIKILAGPKFNSLNVSTYLIARKFDPPADKLLYIFFCPVCYQQLLDPISKSSARKIQGDHMCEKCEESRKISLDSSNYYVSIDIEYQIRILLEDSCTRNILIDRFREIQHRLNESTNNICDVHDGSLYKRTVRKLCNTESVVLTVNFNTDGAPLFRSSKRSFWPLQLTINELPPKLRFRTLILGAVWIAEAEPKPAFLNLYMKSFVNQMNSLTRVGIQVTGDQGEMMNFKVVPLFACVDSVARPIMQNRLQFNGYMGCSWCYAYGEYAAHAMRYPITNDDADLRTHGDYLEDVDAAQKSEKPIRGVKGYSILADIPEFDCIWGLPPEYMHAILLGVARQLWELWTAPGGEIHLTQAQRNQLNERLLYIRPPHELHRLPRTLQDKSKWKASEWRSWLLFYSIPCLSGILPSRALESFSLLVRSVHSLLVPKIMEQDLKQCEIDLIRFVGECQILYGKKAMTFNVHSLLHLTEAVRRCGPLWATSAFPYEGGIFHLKNQVNGPRGVTDQIAKGILQMYTFQSHISGMPTRDACAEYCQSIFSKRKLISQFEKSDQDAVLLGEERGLEDKFTHLTCDDARNNVKTGRIFNRCIYKNTVYHSVMYTRPTKTKDTVVKLKSGTFVEILNFILSDGTCYIRASNISTKSVRSNVQMAHMKQVVRTDWGALIVPIADIECKVIYVDVKYAAFICIPPNVFEVQ